MQTVLNSTDVRANFGEFIDNVVRQRPQVVKRNRDTIVALSQQNLKDLLSVYRFTVDVERDEDGRYVGNLDQIDDIVADGETMEEMYVNLARYLIEYGQDYYSDFNRYYNSPNRRSHAYYALRVLLEDNFETVVGMLRA